MMREMKTTGEKNAKKPKQQMLRKEALESFKRITQATAILAWRSDYRRYMQKLNDEQVRQFQNSIDDNYPPDDELKAELGTDRKSYEAFWGARLSSQKLFDDYYGWLPECNGLVIGKQGEKPIVLVFESAEMAMLLTEDLAGYSSLRLAKLRGEVSYCFEVGQCDIAELIPALHDSAVSRFLFFLDGEQISDLIQTIAERIEFSEFAGTDCIAKIARNLNDMKKGDQLWRLGDYCISRSGRPAFNIRKALIEHGGQEGKAVTEQLIEYMRAVSGSLLETLSYLEGEKHD